MKLFLSQILFTGFVLALYFVFVIFRKGELKYKENRLFSIFCISSALWSFGFFGVIVQTDPDKAYAWRALGMIGTFSYLISAQFLIFHFSEIKNIWRYIAEGFSFTAIIIYCFVIQKDQVTYELSDIGMTYSFKSGLWNNLYITYSIIIALTMLVVILYMLIKSKTQRIKELAKKLLLTEIILVLGMILDTIFPIIGKTALPGSTIAQFLGLAVMYHTIMFVSSSRITIENMSEFIYYSLTIPVIVCDSNKEIKIFNDTAYSFLGVSKGEDLSYKNIDDLFTLEDLDIFTFDGKSQDIDTVCCNNNIHCSLSINKIHDRYGDLTGYIFIVTDLSERIKSIEELEAALKDAEYANKAKSTFLANMSHEIRTPMNAIIGFSELTLKMDIDEQVRKNIEDIKWSSHNLLAIINDILDISKIESGKIELVLGNYYTSTLLNDVSLIIAPQAAKKGLEFTMKVDERIPKKLNGDKVRIRGVLINILNNAIKYTKKGSITFEVSIIELTDKNVKLKFVISDTGVGIHENDLDNIFKTFERLDQKVHYGIEGSGLGLAIANSYINLMGGSIGVDSTYGKGSVFTIKLDQKIIDAKPIEKDYTNQTKHTVSTSSNMKVAPLPVLVVDDNLINLRVAHGILTYYGLKVDTASSGEDAIEMCRNKEYPLVFLDQMMPSMDGVETMMNIRSLSSYYDFSGDSKIIVLTADAIKGARENLLDKGFDEYLGKPINVEQLERLFIKFIPSNQLTYDSTKPVTPENKKLNKEILYLKKFLPQADVEKGVFNCGGSVEDYLNILKITYEYGELQLSELEEFWKQKDYENYIIKIHSLKSTSLNIGAIEISDAARLQEEKGREGDLSYIDSHIYTFKDSYLELLKNIKNVLIDYSIIENETTVSVELDDSMILTVFNTIEMYINDFNFSKVFLILEEIKKYDFPEKYANALTEIEKLMENLSVDEIKELLYNIKQTN